jgi:hypothetical protein
MVQAVWLSYSGNFDAISDSYARGFKPNAKKLAGFRLAFFVYKECEAAMTYLRGLSVALTHLENGRGLS